MTTEDRECVVQHLAAAIEVRLHEIKDSPALAALHLDTSQPAIQGAAQSALERMTPQPSSAGEGVTVRRLLQILQSQTEDTLARRLVGDDGKPVMSLSVLISGTGQAHVVWNTNAGE